MTVQGVRGGQDEETRFEELKRYVRFTGEDAERLRAFHPLARPHFERIAGAFYERIREHEEAHAVLKDEEQVERLRASLVRWLDRMLSGPYDEAYFENTSAIGRVHVRVGLPQRYMLTAMALIRVELCRIAELAPEPTLVREAVSRLLDVELAIVLESYREDYVRRIERRTGAEREALYFERALELVGAMIVGVDHEGLIRLFNREAERVTGYARDEALGTAFAARLMHDDGDARAIADAVVAGKQSLARVDALLTTRAGRVRKIRWHLTHTGGDGDAAQAMTMVGAGLDITDEHHALERAKQHEKLATVGVLAAGLAHEIRNPLNGAQLHVAFLERSLRKQNAASDLIDAVSVVDDEIKRLARLVTEFLDFARPRPLDRRATDIGALCERVVELKRELAAQKHILVSTDLPTTALVARVDGSKLEQVLLNLVENAVEAIEPSGKDGRVVVRARRHPHAILIDVEDDGPGVTSPSALIFDAFYSTKPQGTGLGLAIAMRIVTDHGGTIQVDSKPGRTRFSIILPWDPAETAQGFES